jgi:hypothetical protein
MSEVFVEDNEIMRPWLQPFSEHRILAGFLRQKQVSQVHPAAVFWPADVADRVTALHGAVDRLSPRPEAGQCKLLPIEEPEALAVLQRASEMLPLGSNLPVSYSWVEISNLIALSAITDALTHEGCPPTDTLQALSEYSLLGSSPNLYLANGTLYSSVPFSVKPAEVGMQGDRLVLSYQLLLPVQPILVGYEHGRLYLLNNYGRVISALTRNIDRLLCLVYYGLDLADAHMGVHIGGVTENHFGQLVLSGEKPPMVKDFLDPSLSAPFSARPSFVTLSPILQVRNIQITPPNMSKFPLDVETTESATT